MSSDSEDDCYGNVAQQLQKMKNKYQDDKIETTNLLEDTQNDADDSTELDEMVKNCKKAAKTAPKPVEENSNSPTYDLPDVSPAISAKKPKKRTTRNSRKNESDTISTSCELPPTRAKRKKTAANTSTASSSANISAEDLNESLNVANSSNAGGRGARGRGRGQAKGRKKSTPSRSRGRRRGWWAPRRMHTVADFFAALMPFSCDASIPTYSVGNTEEYFDQSEQQQLFTNQSKKTDDVIDVDQDVSLDDNEELSVKVYWQSSEFFKFQIRKYQKLSQIFEYFSKKENVSQDKLLLTFNDRILKPEDTPDAIGYSIVKFIDGGIVNQSVSHFANKEDTTPSDGIRLKFQCQNTKKPLELCVRPEDKFSVAMLKCAEHLEIPLDRLRFEFDGDLIPGRATASELELEGGECIDVKMLS